MQFICVTDIYLQLTLVVTATKIGDF